MGDRMSRLDKECVKLIEAMNTMPGIRTFESCCGHGDYPFRIWFFAESLEVLPELLYWFDGCHCGVYGWEIIASTDCSMAPARFRVESTEMGCIAYEEADEIADMIMKRGEGIERDRATGS
jgi:hypothetical protein